MILTDIAQLKPSDERAVIINVGTKLVATLSLLSTLRHAEMPTLVIDCESNDGSWDHFCRLMKSYEFDLLAAPLKPHGATLDWLFQNIPAQKTLLVDSDVEIFDPDLLRFMRRFIDNPLVFGGGFLHGPCWMATHPGVGYYQERPWMPIAMLKTSCVRRALAAGRSFLPKTIPNDCAASKFISRVLGRRFRFSRTRNWRLSWFDRFKGNYYGQKPCYVFCDTGAVVYQYLKHDCGLYFAGVPAEVQNCVTHFHGVTRLKLDPTDPIAADLADIAATVRNRLEQVYNFPWLGEM
jgi:hypothetical protein